MILELTTLQTFLRNFEIFYQFQIKCIEIELLNNVFID